MKTFLPSLAILFLIQLTSTAAIGQDLISLQRQDSKPASAKFFIAVIPDGPAPIIATLFFIINFMDLVNYWYFVAVSTLQDGLFQ